jgi:hypothetical protein
MFFFVVKTCSLGCSISLVRRLYLSFVDFLQNPPVYNFEDFEVEGEFNLNLAPLKNPEPGEVQLAESVQ